MLLQKLRCRCHCRNPCPRVCGGGHPLGHLIRSHMHIHIYIACCDQEILKQSHLSLLFSSGVCEKNAGPLILLNLPVPLTPLQSNVDCAHHECAERAKKKLKVVIAQKSSCFNFGQMGVRGKADADAHRERSSFFFADTGTLDNHNGFDFRSSCMDFVLHARIHATC